MRTLMLLLFTCFYLLPLTLHADIKGKKKPVAKKKITLMNTYWRLAEMNGKEIPDTDNANTPYIYLQQKKSQLLGHTGCNTVGGEFAEGKYKYLGFEATHTEMACPGVATEEYLLNALKHTNRYNINGDNLLLYNDNVLLAVFEAK